jgi:hypothetical protein
MVGENKRGSAQIYLCKYSITIARGMVGKNNVDGQLGRVPGLAYVQTPSRNQIKKSYTGYE